MVLIAVLIYDDSRRHMSGASRWRMGYAVAFFMFLIILWNMIVLLWKLLEYMMKCKAAKAASLGTGVATGLATGYGTVGNRIDGLHRDTDYETSGTRYVRD